MRDPSLITSLGAPINQSKSEDIFQSGLDLHSLSCLYRLAHRKLDAHPSIFASSFPVPGQSYHRYTYRYTRFLVAPAVHARFPCTRLSQNSYEYTRRFPRRLQTLLIAAARSPPSQVPFRSNSTTLSDSLCGPWICSIRHQGPRRRATFWDFVQPAKITEPSLGMTRGALG
jgi:hypothetical protein